MTAEEALRQAEAEGLSLQTSDNSSTGYKYVAFSKRRYGEAKPYQAAVRRDGKLVSLGSFATAEEAALVLARDALTVPSPAPACHPMGQQAPAVVVAAAAAPPAECAPSERRKRVQHDAPRRAQPARAVVGSPRGGNRSAADAAMAARVDVDAGQLPKGRPDLNRERGGDQVGGVTRGEHAVEADGVIEESDREVTIIDGIVFVATSSPRFNFEGGVAHSRPVE